MPKATFLNLPEEKRKRIIEAAVSEFSRVHYTKVTIDNIVKEAKIPKGSFYQYFSNKDDLYVYMFTQFGDTKMKVLVDLKKEVNKLSFKEYMMKFITELKNLEFSSSKFHQLKQEYLNECPQEIRRTLLKNELPKYLKILQEVIELYIKKGEFRKDLESKIAAYVTMMSISNLEFYNFNEEDDIKKALFKIIDFLDYALK